MKFKKKYSKIPNLYRTEAQSIFSLENVVITEKIDGTNFSFGFQDCRPTMNSRNNIMWVVNNGTENHIQTYDGFGAVKRFKELFPWETIWEDLRSYSNDDILIYGEFYGQGIQKRIDYCEDKRFVFFDAYNLNKEEWLPYAEFLLLCDKLNLPVAPHYYIGPPKLSKFENMLKKATSKISEGEDVPIEGFVIKGLLSEKDKWGDRIIAKYKTEKFNEIKKVKHKKPKQEDQKYHAYAEYIAEKYVTQSRLENCLEKLRSENLPTTSIKITGAVIKYMTQDILEEMEEEDKNHKDYDVRFYKKVVGRSISECFRSYLHGSINNCK